MNPKTNAIIPHIIDGFQEILSKQLYFSYNYMVGSKSDDLNTVINETLRDPSTHFVNFQSYIIRG